MDLIFSMAHWYVVGEHSIRKVFIIWIMFPFKDHRYIMFHEQKEFKDPLPKLFHTFNNIHASVDCTEFKCEMP